MADHRSPERQGSAGIYQRPARRLPWPAYAAGIALAAGILAVVLWMT